MWRVLGKAGVPQNLVNLIRDLHDGAQAVVRVDGKHTAPFEVKGGLRQGCTLAPALSIIYMAAVIHVWRERVESDMRLEFDMDSTNLKRPFATRRVAGEAVLNDVKFADDVGALCREFEVAVQQIQEFGRTTANFGLQTAWGKTEVLPVGTQCDDVVFTDYKGEEQVVKAAQKFKYLDGQVSSGCTMDDGVEYRLARATETYSILRKSVFRNGRLSKHTKSTIYRVTILSSLLHSAECWYGLNQVRHNIPAGEISNALCTGYMWCLAAPTA